MIEIKSADAIKKMRAANQIVGQLLEALAPLVVPGVSTAKLDAFAEEFIRSHGAEPAFKGYKVTGLPPFPGSVCSSINHQIVHGIPSAGAVLKEGDIIGIDVGTVKDGYYGDGARTYAVGTITPLATKLMEVTKNALALGIEAAVAGNRVGDISSAIGNYVRKEGFYVADNLTGHGIGRNLHEDPMVPNRGVAGRGPRLYAGMTIAIEPMVNVGTNKTRDDGWEVSVADGTLSAHFEHTILITNSQAEILTRV